MYIDTNYLANCPDVVRTEYLKEISAQNIFCNNLDDYRDKVFFSKVCESDNVSALTLCPRPGVSIETLMVDIMSYCDKRDMALYLVKEKASQIHFHGIVCWNTSAGLKALQTMWNRKYGKIRIKQINNPEGWFSYIHKDVESRLVLTSRDHQEFLSRIEGNNAPAYIQIPNLETESDEEEYLDQLPERKIEFLPLYRDYYDDGEELDCYNPL